MIEHTHTHTGENSDAPYSLYHCALQTNCYLVRLESLPLLIPNLSANIFLYYPAFWSVILGRVSSYSSVYKLQLYKPRRADIVSQFASPKLSAFKIICNAKEFPDRKTWDQLVLHLSND